MSIQKMTDDLHARFKRAPAAATVDVIRCVPRPDGKHGIALVAEAPDGRLMRMLFTSAEDLAGLLVTIVDAANGTWGADALDTALDRAVKREGS